MGRAKNILLTDEQREDALKFIEEACNCITNREISKKANIKYRTFVSLKSQGRITDEKILKIIDAVYRISNELNEKYEALNIDTSKGKEK